MILRWIRYHFERWMLRGSSALLVLLIAMLATIALTGGLVAHLISDHFHGYGNAVWWAVLRISDPGYLSDDIPDLEIRALSVVLSVLGMSVTVGGIVAIVTQAVNSRLAHLASAITPVPFSDHIVLLGWTDRTPQLLRELLENCDHRVVILLEQVGQEEIRRLARTVPNTRQLERVVLRRGTRTRKVDLRRAACESARAIIIPAEVETVAGNPASGPRILKTLLALRSVFEHSDRSDPAVILEVIDRSLIPLAQGAMPLVHSLHSDRVLARTLRLGLQGFELLDMAVDLARPHRGWKLVAMPADTYLGRAIEHIADDAPDSHLIGVARELPSGKVLLTRPEHCVQESDHVLFLDAPPYSKFGKVAPNSEQIDTWLKRERKRLLILGWSEVLPDLLAQLCLEGPGRYSVDILCTLDVAARARAIAAMTHPGELVDESLINIRHIVGDPLQLDDFAEIEISAYDRCLVLAERHGSSELSDAQTLARVLSVHRRRRSMKPDCTIVAEFLESDDLEILPEMEGLVTPHLIAEVLASLALAPQSHEHLERTLLLKATYLLRAIEVPGNIEWNYADIARKFREQGVSLLQVIRRQDDILKRCQLLVAEPAFANISAPQNVDQTLVEVSAPC